MKRLVWILVLGFGMATTAAAATTWFAPELAGGREPEGQGDPDGRGLAAIGLEADGLRYFLWVTGTTTPTAAHVHLGAAGQPGAVVVDLEAEFEPLGDGFAAAGRVDASASVLADLVAEPAAFYVNVHTAEHTGGAVRAQLVGDGPSPSALAATLRGHRVIGGGDLDGEGFAVVGLEGASAVYYIATEGTEPPTAAHVHAGDADSSGGIAIDLAASFSGGVAFGAAELDEAAAAAVLASPESFYVNVHTPDFPAGAIRGQLRATETTLSFPVVSRIQGQAGSNWRTDLRVLALDDEDVPVWAEWYPLSADGRTTPAGIVEMVVGPVSEAVVDDVVATLFDSTGNGAMRLLAAAPIVAAARIFNDQRDNPEVGGTFGQFSPAVEPSGALRSGVLLLGSNRPAASAEGWRSNLGYFNPNPLPATIELAARSVSGDILGSATVTVGPWANAVRGVSQLIPIGNAPLDDFYVTFAADAGVVMYLSLVDNVTGDAVLVSASPAPAVLPVPADDPAPNRAPNGTIDAPAGDVTITAGGTVAFSGSGTDPDGDALSYLWDFGDGITSSIAAPGEHTFSDVGTFTVTFTVTDSRGLSDPSPDQRTVIVEAAATVTLSEVQSRIFSASCAFSGCHAGSAPAQGLNLSEGQSHASTVNVPSRQQGGLDRVEPGDPSRSYLYLKVIGDDSISGGRMPLGGPVLSQDLVDLLRGWIEAGAPNN